MIDRSPRSADVIASVRFYMLVAFLLLCAAGGGSARADSLSLLYLRPAAVLVVALTLLLPGFRTAPTLRPLVMLLMAAFGWAAIQLVPLPPSLWTALPGHARFAEAATAAGMAQPWRPISISPGWTLNALVSLLTPLAVILGFSALRSEQRLRLLPWAIGIAVASAVIGLLQVTGGRYSPLYLYRYTSQDLPVGFLANRNHQALLLACALPMLAGWARLSAGRGHRGWLALAIGLALLPMILATGSRSGLAVGAAAIVCAALIAPRPPRRLTLARRLAIPGWLVWLAPVALVVVPVAAGRGMSIERLSGAGDLAAEKRLTALPTIWRETREFLPTGTGLGTFDPAYRLFEPDALLTPDYFNHAHNDWVELVMTGGLPAIGLLAAFLLIAGIATSQAVRAKSETPRRTAALTGAAIIVLALIASISDYPARTPLISALLALASGWLVTHSERRRDSGRQTRPAQGVAFRTG